MSVLATGIVLWAVVHLMPAVLPGLRSALIAKLGFGPYKGLFALTIVGSLILIVIGFRGADHAVLYIPPSWGYHAAPIFVLVAFVLFVSARGATNLKRIVRHPQLASVKIWSFGHLLANGEVRSIILFGGLLLWAVADMIAINRRDGAWVKPEPVSRGATTVTTLIGVAAYVAFLFLHETLIGRTPFPS